MRITSFENTEIPFVDLTSVSPIHGVALPFGNLKNYGSNALLFDQWGPSGQFVQVIAHVHVLRQSRISDRLIQLWDGTKLIGKSAHSSSTENIQTYMFSGNFTVDHTFGIVLDFAPHPEYPSSTTVVIKQVTLTFVAA